MIDTDALAAINEDLEHIAARAADHGVGVQIEADDDGVIFLSDIARRDGSSKGAGTKVIEALCRAADLHGVAFETSFMTDETGLGTYYARFGFEIDGEPGKITSLRREPQAGPLPINGIEMTPQLVRATREHFAETSRAAIEDIRNGTTPVDDPDGTIAWFEEGIRSGLAGESDHTVTFRQRAIWVQTGSMPPIFSPPAESKAA